jgi:hypothetical protein
MVVGLCRYSTARNHLLDEDVDVEQGFEGNRHLSHVLWHDLQHLPQYLNVGDVVAEMHISSKPSDAIREIFHVLCLLPHRGDEITVELLCVGLTHPLNLDADLLH